MSSGCKTNSALIIFKHAKIGVRGAKTLIAHTNSLVFFRVKFHVDQGTRGAIEAKS